MPAPRQVIGLLDLARLEERRFVEQLPPQQRELEGTLDDPSPKDTFAHVVFAKRRMLDALASTRAGRAVSSSHSREDAIRYGAGRSFASIDQDGSHVAEALVDEVARLDPEALATSPDWAAEATLGDEIVQHCVTHSLVHLLPATPLEAAARSADVQSLFVQMLPEDIGVRQRSRALYNLACLEVAAGRSDPALTALRLAIALRPELLDHARADPILRNSTIA